MGMCLLNHQETMSSLGPQEHLKAPCETPLESIEPCNHHTSVCRNFKVPPEGQTNEYAAHHQLCKVIKILGEDDDETSGGHVLYTHPHAPSKGTNQRTILSSLGPQERLEDSMWKYFRN